LHLVLLPAIAGDEVWRRWVKRSAVILDCSVDSAGLAWDAAKRALGDWLRGATLRATAARLAST
jgi:hypothetical protein